MIDAETRGHGDAESPEGESVEVGADDLLAGVEAPGLVSSEDSQLKAVLGVLAMGVTSYSST